jgi:hypothetical protein
MAPRPSGNVSRTSLRRSPTGSTRLATGASGMYEGVEFRCGDTEVANSGQSPAGDVDCLDPMSPQGCYGAPVLNLGYCGREYLVNIPSSSDMTCQSYPIGTHDPYHIDFLNLGQACWWHGSAEGEGARGLLTMMCSF